MGFPHGPEANDQRHRFKVDGGRTGGEMGKGFFYLIDGWNLELTTGGGRRNSDQI